ncbi:MAG: polyphosphate polymerase domain-containing protein [Lachnospiraceae bacterium]|nr:polyphosphate polymerase domain-containing protein [Lachnospiraceae bacterium]
MAFQTVFKRYELKYMLTTEQKEQVVQAMEPYMSLDSYGRTTIRNIYFDTDNYRLIRHSIEGVGYKEKLRIRSYGKADPDSTVFVELKKKYQSIVYKRRIAMPEETAMKWVLGESVCPEKNQISQEIDYFFEYYETLHPAVFLTYEREAFYAKDQSDFRVTFDDTILCRREDLSLESDVYGTQLLPDGMVLMELKCSGSIPMWLTHVLSKERIYKTSFSKYGTAYKMMILPQYYAGGSLICLKPYLKDYSIPQSLRLSV